MARDFYMKLLCLQIDLVLSVEFVPFKSVKDYKYFTSFFDRVLRVVEYNDQFIFFVFIQATEKYVIFAVQVPDHH